MQNLAAEIDKKARERGTLTCTLSGVVNNLRADPKMFWDVLNPKSRSYVDSRLQQANLVIEALKMSQSCGESQSRDFIREVPPIVWRILNNAELFHVVENMCNLRDRSIMLQQIRELGDPTWISAIICEIFDILACDVYLSSITKGMSREMWRVLNPHDVMNLIMANCVHQQEDGFEVLNHALENRCLCPTEHAAHITRIVRAIATNVKTVPENMWKYMLQSSVKEALLIACGDDDEISFEPWEYLTPESMKELIDETLSTNTRRQLIVRATNNNVWERFTVTETSNFVRHFIATDFLTAEDFPDELWRNCSVRQVLTVPGNLESKENAVDVFMHAHALGCVDVSNEWVESFIRHVTKSGNSNAELGVHPSCFSMEVLEPHRDLLFDLWESHHLKRIISEATPGDDVLNIEHWFNTWKTPNNQRFYDWMLTRVTTKEIVKYLLDQAHKIIKTFQLMQQIRTSVGREDILNVTDRDIEIEKFAKDILKYKAVACTADENSVWNE